MPRVDGSARGADLRRNAGSSPFARRLRKRRVAACEWRTAAPSYATISKHADPADYQVCETASHGKFTHRLRRAISPLAYSASREAPDGSPRHKLDRLCELRAVIETLRCERAAQDPLLAWIIEQEREDIRRRD